MWREVAADRGTPAKALFVVQGILELATKIRRNIIADLLEPQLKIPSSLTSRLRVGSSVAGNAGQRL
jgi:hypothetical protein